jgi:hypothetical protein
VDGTVGYDINGQVEISGKFFGVTAFEGFPNVVAYPQYKAMVALPRPGFFRFPGYIEWFTPADQTQPSSPPPTDLPLLPEMVWRFTQGPLNTWYYPYGRMFPAVGEMKADVQILLQGGPPWSVVRVGNDLLPKDFSITAELMAGFVRLCRLNGGAWLRYVQIYNEPNSTWWMDPRFSGAYTAPQAYSDFFNIVSQRLKSEFPNLLVGGPTLCWPPAWPPAQAGQPNWYTWDGWTVPFIQNCGSNADYFDFHAYDISREQIAEQLTLLSAEANASLGKNLPVIISESNYRLDFTDAQAANVHTHYFERTLPYERFLFALLDHTDKVVSNMYHDLHHTNISWIYPYPDAAWEETPTYWIYWLMRNLRGRRLFVESSPTMPVAATVEGSRYTILVFNNMNSTRTIEANLSLAQDARVRSTRVESVRYDSSQGILRHGQVVSNPVITSGNVRFSIILTPYASYSLNVELESSPVLPKVLIQKEYYASPRMNRLTTGSPAATLSVALPKISADTQVILRVGVLGASAAGQIELSVGTFTIPLGSEQFQEIPMLNLLHEGVNSLVFRTTNPQPGQDLRISVASVITRQIASVAIANIVRNPQGSISVSWNSMAGNSYYVYYKDDFYGSWMAVRAGMPIIGTGGMYTWTDDGTWTGPLSAAGERYYMVEVR